MAAALPLSPAQKVQLPRWELQLWITAVKTSTGKTSTAQGKSAKCLMRFPLDAPIQIGGWLSRTLPPWLSEFVNSGAAELPEFDGRMGYELIDRTALGIPRALSLSCSGGSAVLTRDALVKLVRMKSADKDADEVLGEWSLSFPRTPQTYCQQCIVQADKQKQLWVAGRTGTSKSANLEIIGLIIGPSFLEEAPLRAVVDILRAEHLVVQVAKVKEIIQVKRAAFKRAREELEDAEEQERRLCPATSHEQKA